MKKFLRVIATIIIVAVFVFLGKYGFDEYQKYQEEKIAEEMVISVACVGDSLTFGRSYTKEVYNYPSFLGELLGEKYKVKNYGMGGTCVQTDLAYPYRSTRAYRMSVESESDILIVMLGTNDIWNEGWRDKETFYQHYNDFLDSYLQTEHTPKIYLCTLPKIYIKEENEYGKAVLERNKWITEVIRHVADERDYPLIEMDVVTAERPEWYEDDGLHFNYHGASGVAQAVFETLKKDIE